MRRLTIITAVLLGLTRLAITPRLNLPTATGTYEAVAHLFVGGMFGWWLSTRSKLALQIIVALSALELLCFGIQRFGF